MGAATKSCSEPKDQLGGMMRRPLILMTQLAVLVGSGLPQRRPVQEFDFTHVSTLPHGTERVQFVTSSHAYGITGDRPIASNDGGRTWFKMRIGGPDFRIARLFASGPLRADALGYSAGQQLIYRTADGGITWDDWTNDLRLPKGFRALDLRVGSNGEEVWVGGSFPLQRQVSDLDVGESIPAVLYRPNGRDVLRVFRLSEGGSHPIDALVGPATTTRLALSRDSAYVYQSDQGRWSLANFGPEERGLVDARPLGAFFLDSSTGWLSYSSGALFVTADGGVHWRKVMDGGTLWPDPRKPAGFIRISFRSSKLGLAVGWGVMFSTVDGGHTWSRLKTPDNIWDFGLYSNDKGWAFSEGSLYQLTVSHPNRTR